MPVIRIATRLPLVAAALASLVLPTASHAFGRGVPRGPAEVPPASFRELQYVDSRGCVFLRAGDLINRVVWIPRMDNNLTMECGYLPTFRNDG